jgi:hypothetical protein
MDSKLVLFPTGKVHPQALLEKAKEWSLKEFLILGYDEYEELCIAGTTYDYKDNIALLEHAKYFLLKQHFDEEIKEDLE